MNSCFARGFGADLANGDQVFDEAAVVVGHGRVCPLLAGSYW